MKVFLTGSTGFVGSHVARAYAAAGAELRLLTRKTSRLSAIEGIAAEVVVGDLRQTESLRTAVRGCDALVHVAADYRLWVRDPKEMYAANVDGTRELLRLASEEAGLDFLSVRLEDYDLVFGKSLQDDPRIQALIRVARSAAYRRLLGDLPGYDVAQTGELEWTSAGGSATR